MNSPMKARQHESRQQVRNKLDMKRKYSIIQTRSIWSGGFSLLELLVVIAVISLLLAILLPVLRQARIVSRRVVCKSNLKQIALAWHMYLDNNDGLFYQGTNHNYDFGGWQGRPIYALYRPLNRHLKLPCEMREPRGAEVFRCPADDGEAFDPQASYDRYGNSYQANLLLASYQVPVDPAWVPDPPRSINVAINQRLRLLMMARVSEPSQVLLVGDRHWVTQWDPLWRFSCGRAWHNRYHTYNIAFLDGHVDYIKIRKGLYVTPEYHVQPFRELCTLASESQREVPCPCGQE
jgi:prepilin-type N-terminal cleavage/methylation domain-containing protein/prepilin-type processing-associated H-X9-DG protein